jgi:hypothetical protein
VTGILNSATGGPRACEEATDTRAVIEINSIPALSALEFRS